MIALATVASAQTAQPPSQPAVAAPAQPASGEDSVKLDPFEVKADSSNSYSALNSNSVTRFNTDLNHLAVSADIFDQAFMDDVASTSVEGMIQTYSAGAGYSSPAGASGAAAANQPGDRTGNGYIQLRGQNTPVEVRDGFMPVGAFGNPGSTGVGYTSNFDLERVEVINGPQALLYGGGGAGGVINVVSKQARFDQPAFGNLTYQFDQYGSKLGQFDYGLGNDWFGVRVAAVHQVMDTRRVNIGGDINGQYIQMALKIWNTTIRMQTEETTYNRWLSASPTLTAPTSDTRNGDSIHYLLATGQTGTTNPQTGAAYTSGAIDNGLLNWSNVDSYGGFQYQEPVENAYSSLQVDSQWAPWLSTQFAVGYDPYKDERINPGVSFYAPGGSGNTTSGWAAGLTPSTTWQPATTKGIRFSTLLTNKFLDNRVKSQSIFGWDFVRTDMAQIAYEYVKADSSFNPIPGTGTAAWSAVLGKQIWSIDQGLVTYPLFFANGNDLVINGTNYVRMPTNPVNPALISPANPTGAELASGNYILTKILNSGIYGINYTQWFDGKLDTMAGFRAANSDEWRINQGTGPTVWWNTASKTVSFNLGADYALTSWMRPYATVSDSYDPPFLENASDPYNKPPTTSHALGEEVGLKFSTPDDKISATVSVYHVNSKNTPYQVTSTLSTDINPAGLNGGGGGAYIDENIVTKGLQVTATANPIAGLRLRLSGAVVGGSLGKTATYAQVYNDQFYENAQGDVTYQDGTPVYVNPTTFNSKSPVSTSTTPGAVPLTVTMMSTPGGLYYANPTIVNGAISSGSNAASVLKIVDPTHGPILTGASGLPISSYQLNTALTGVSPVGIIPVATSGQDTVGYPHFSTNLTGVYEFGSGWERGFRIGGSVIANWQIRDYYYYASGVSQNAVASLYELPTSVQANLITGYTRKFRRVTWGIQLNVTNVFNHYDIVILPNATTGYTTPAGLNATFTNQPRMYTLTNTLKF